MGKVVRVLAPARVHFGVLNPFGSAPGRKFVCLGLAVREPRTVVEAEYPGRGEVVPDIPEVRDVLARLWSVYEVDVDRVNVRVISHAPRHAGLGSTTQLKLSVGLCVLSLFGKSVDVVELAKVLGRGEVSGVGTYVFKHGGLVLDSGKLSDEFPMLTLRLEFPEEWTIIIGVPRRARGPDEVREHELFASTCEPELVYYAHFIVLNKLLPAVIGKNFTEFVSALEELQITVGKMFSKVQGGVFRKETETVLEIFRSFGLRGIGQSSWGPAAYGFLEHYDEDLVSRLCRELEKADAECIVTRSDNVGARVLVIDQ